jgi:hypothetical protein
VDRDAARIQRRDVHVACGAGTEKNDMPQRRALRDDLGRQIGVVVQHDIVTGKDLRDGGAVVRFVINRDGRIVLPPHDREDRPELIVAVKKKGLHGIRKERARTARPASLAIPQRFERPKLMASNSQR